MNAALVQPLWRIVRHTKVRPPEKRVPADIPIARSDFLDMGAVLEAHMDGRRFLVGDRATIADFIAAYTIDMASLVATLLDGLSRLRAYMERRYAWPKARRGSSTRSPGLPAAARVEGTCYHGAKQTMGA